MKDQKRLERYQRWKAVFDTPHGVSVLAELQKMCGQDQTSVVQSVVDGMIDPFYTLLREGRRSLWLDIQANLTEPPEIPEGQNEGED
jgi:hypothetical protein